MIATRGSALLAYPRAGRAQQSAAVPRVGCLMVAPVASLVVQQLLGAFRDGLRGLGYAEGRSIAFEYRSAEGKIERLRTLAADLEGLVASLSRPGGNVTGFTAVASDAGG